VPTGNFLNRSLVCFDIPEDFNEEEIRKLFENPTRIDRMEFITDQKLLDVVASFDLSPENQGEKLTTTSKRACMLHFLSNSAARKTLDTVFEDQKYIFYWVGETGKIAKRAEPYKRKFKEDLDKKESTSEDCSDSFEESSPSSGPCWASCVFPSLEENYNSGTCNVMAGLYSKGGSIRSLWNQVEAKQIEARSMIMEDPDFIKKLLMKTLDDDYLNFRISC